MFGTGVQFGRGNVGDQFYDPLSGRRYPHVQRPRSNGGLHCSKPKPVAENREPENRTRAEECARSVASSASSSGRGTCGNLDRFLMHTTPVIPAQYLPKTSIKGWRTCEVHSVPFFTLGDLWESFKEWSAYGAGVPLVLNGSDSVIQYYVPYLSAIQLYAVSSKPFRRPGEESDASDGDYYRDTSSETSSDGEVERASEHIRTMQWRNHQIFQSNLGFDRLLLGEQSKSSNEGFSSDDGEGGNSASSLVFEYFERAPPFSREPLADKIADLARKYPGLKTLRSIDLLPESWISVAWYPIYRIPTGPTLRDLDACFLTFHSLSTPLKDGGNTQFGAEGQGFFASRVFNNPGKPPMIRVPVFGLASYKFRGAIWTSNGTAERQQVSSLLQSAEKWLRFLRVEHPDFHFFLSNGSSYRR